MATHVIEIDPFNPLSILRADLACKRISREFDEKVDEYLRGLAEIGERAAQGAYAGTPVDVSVQKLNDGYSVSADGREVVFLEFGAGSTVNVSNRFAGDMPFEVSRGSYSDSKNPPGEYAKTGYKYWHVGQNKVTHVDPRNGMHKAYKAIMSDMQDLAKVVFG